MFGFRSNAGSNHDPEAVSFVDQLNHLETRVGKLELEQAERQLTVLKTVEKVLYQLRARTAKREKTAEDAPSEENAAEEQSYYGPQRTFEPTAHLSRRFRGI
jgi:ABC-type uncharacterized transport system permease subunit